MSRELFRKEAVDAKRGSWLGAIAVNQPLSLKICGIFAASSALLIVIFLLLGTYTRRTQVDGRLVSIEGAATLLAPSTGVIKQIDTGEGSQVQSGQRMAVIEMPHAAPDGGDSIAALKKRLNSKKNSVQEERDVQRSLLNAKYIATTEQLRGARVELEQLQGEIASRKKQTAILSETLVKMRPLLDQHYVSQQQIKEYEIARLDSIANGQMLERQATTLQRNIAELQSELEKIPDEARVSEATFEKQSAEIEQEEIETSARGILAVRAPINGTVATQLLKPGQTVQSGEPMMVVLPGSGNLEAELFVPSRSVGFIQPGDKVLLRYQAYPYQKFGHQNGTVKRISRNALSERELNTLQKKNSLEEPLYRVTIQLQKQYIVAYGKRERLMPGMVINADILGERRKLIEWIFEPIYSVRGRFG